jgi:hypothetical protein
VDAGPTDAGPTPDADAAHGSYELALSVTQIPADGFTKIPVLAIGQHADGSPATDAVVLSIATGKGTLSSTALSLGIGGTTVEYTPCSSAADPACAGPLKITMALASAPQAVIASTVGLTLVAPTGVGSPAPCLGGGNVLYFDGDTGDYIHPGMQTITGGTFTAQYSADQVSLSVNTSNGATGALWSLTFATDKLGQPIGAQVYDNTQRAPFEASGQPGLDVSGDGRGCNTSNGAFQIETLTATGTTLHGFTATFEQHCEGATPALHGCVHFEQ